MRRVFCDFHIHSCLSPCGDDTMTPALAAGLLKLSGYDVAALTDHNAVGNCPAFFRACESYDLTPLAGMELTTAEDIHLVCLLPTCSQAMAFGDAVNRHRILIRNRPQFFGHQLLMDAEDNLLGEEPNLLPNATDLSLEDAFALAQEFGAICYPAHVDRESNGILAVLGDMPEVPAFTHAEFRQPENREDWCLRYPRLRHLIPLFGSDAHRPNAITDAAFSIEISQTGDVAQAVIEALSQGGCP